MAEISATSGTSHPEPEDFNVGASVKVALVAALGGFLFGYDSAVINGAVSAIGTYFDVESGDPRASPSPQRCSARPWAPSSPATSPTGSADCP